MYEAYDIVTNTEAYGGQNSWYVPGPDPEHNQPNYYTQGVRRFRFGGQTAADEGIRMALEQMMANTGWSNPNVVKYMVIFTDGAWNTTRTMVAAPGYTNVVTGPPCRRLRHRDQLYRAGNQYDLRLHPGSGDGAVAQLLERRGQHRSTAPTDHQYDIIQSIGSSNDDVAAEANSYVSSTLIGAPQTYITNTFLENYPGVGDVYTTNVNVWLPPGAVDYVYRTTNASSNPAYLDKNETTVSEIDNPTNDGEYQLGHGRFQRVGRARATSSTAWFMTGLTWRTAPSRRHGSGAPANDIYMRMDNFIVPWMWPDADAVVGDGTANAAATGCTADRCRGNCGPGHLASAC